ncbi:ABC-2 type transport system ATP-binding protein [Anaerovirgula multivorans]|uniref:ABC-2 type transport system ATP-binding protein n=1 Tax=Anaerovirgula multivorans TaxID=312168 RepID=A0A239BCJ4_9FIRM|nr:ABC transporter ATP-binding protein [Anaerovirgula multivorans]SNS04884.1 ABC-2 type transport system ATP-binding protein [Anaerovirgula multivorans]
MKILEFQDVEYGYKTNKVIEAISFTLGKGEIVGLLGPNGAGKSTILSIAATLLKPTKGSVLYYEKRLQEHKEIRRLMGFVPQEIALYGNMTAKENLYFFGELYGLKGEELRIKSEEAGEMVAISLKETQKIKELSGGMKRRINIAVALLNSPEILVMDEPTVGIDLQSKQYILKAMEDLKNKGTSILYASHHTDEILNLCTRILLLNEGKIIADQSIKELKKYGLDTVKTFEEEVMKFFFQQKTTV